MDINDIYNLLKKVFEDGIGELKTGIPVEDCIYVEAGKIEAVCFFLRDEERLQFDALMCLSGVDKDKTTLTTVYHLYSYALKQRLTIKVDVPKDNPVVQSVYQVWSTAEWHERESFDLLGIKYEGNPDLRRILLPEDWEGHPLLKDYKVQEFYNGMKVPY